MGQLVLTMKYRKNTGMIFNPTEIFSLYLYGITIQEATGLLSAVKVCGSIYRLLKERLRTSST